MKNQTVSHDDWTEARKALLTEEKQLTRQRDEVTRLRRELPWERVEKEYVFEGPNGKETLGDLFEGRSQLIVYHFMFDPDWDVGCKSCSFLADHYEPAIAHLAQRDVTMVTVSRAPLPQLETFRERMGWGFKWVSSHGSDFNRDYHVTFSEDEIESGKAYYNYEPMGFPSKEAPGASVFYKDDEGEIFHTYSVYQRGLDRFIAAYHWLDIVPKGRDEEGLDYPMEWVRLHDEY